MERVPGSSPEGFLRCHLICPRGPDTYTLKAFPIDRTRIPQGSEMCRTKAVSPPASSQRGPLAQRKKPPPLGVLGVKLPANAMLGALAGAVGQPSRWVCLVWFGTWALRMLTVPCSKGRMGQSDGHLLLALLVPL